MQITDEYFRNRAKEVRQTEIDVKNITGYIDYLIGRTGLFITLHGEIASVPALARYNFHLNPYCRYIKTICSNWDVCIKRQGRVFEKCADGPFYGTCHAGVGEYIYPVTAHKRVIGFLSVSGYRGREEETAIGKTMHFAKKNGMDGAMLLRMREKFLCLTGAEDGPPDAILYPLVFMLENYFDRQHVLPETTGAGNLFSEVFRFITENHDKPLTMEILGRHFHYSVSTLSHLFRKNTGLSLNGYIESLRLDEAEWLLRQSSLTISEIAACVGFCTPAYFSTVFKKKTGLTPKEYRRMGANAPVTVK